MKFGNPVRHLGIDVSKQLDLGVPEQDQARDRYLGVVGKQMVFEIVVMDKIS